ncbi:MAG TPA: hypothetical protein VFM37_11290 [Pseudonocardiaceae bacterium]|nr:hypothetical protein [Pseudonocardiaceae bacterium]
MAETIYVRELAAQLGLAAGASEAEVPAAVKARRSAATRPPDALMYESMWGNGSLLVDGAISDGRISSARRGHYLAMFAKDPRGTEALLRELTPVPGLDGQAQGGRPRGALPSGAAGRPAAGRQPDAARGGARGRTRGVRARGGRKRPAAGHVPGRRLPGVHRLRGRPGSDHGVADPVAGPA